MSDAIYKENLLDHYRNPRNFGKLKTCDLKNREFNPVCGDEVEFFLKFKNGKVSEVKFDGRGCAISQASASMLSEKIKGMSKTEVKKLAKDDILKLLGIKVGVVRLKCALLPLKALQGGIDVKD